MNDRVRRSVLDIEAARQLILRSVHTVEKEHAGVINALGRTLAEDLTSSADIPSHPTAKSAGYAAISSDTSGASAKDPCHLSVLSESAHKKRIEPGTVIRVGAGDVLPMGADTVVEERNVYRPDGGVQVMVMAESKPGANIAAAGAVVGESEVALHAGSRIHASDMALIAMLGRPGVLVSRKPRIAIITTGARVVDIADELKPGEQRNGARYAMVGMLIEAGCELGRLVHVREGRLALEKAIERCAGCDAFIVALGDHDRHDAAVHALCNSGAVAFERVLMEPGAEFAYGDAVGRPIFIAQGSALAEVFEALIRPALLKMLGRSKCERDRIRATLLSTLKPNPSCCHWIRAVTRFEDGSCVTKPLGKPCEPHNSFILIPAGVDAAKRGENVDVVLT